MVKKLRTNEIQLLQNVTKNVTIKYFFENLTKITKRNN